jgi:hypothetical protein
MERDLEETPMKLSSWILCLLSAAAWAQTPALPGSSDDEAEWVKIRALKSVYEDAVSSNQIEKLKPYIAGNFHAVLVTGAEAAPSTIWLCAIRRSMT